jgi:PAS domain S-box-containing protein
VTPLSSAQLADLWNAAPDAMLVIDADGLVMGSNRSAEELFGYDPAELHGQHTSVLIAMDDRELRATPSEVWSTGHRRDGVEFPAEITASKIASKSKSALIVVVRDVSQRSELDAQRIREIERAHQLLEAAKVKTDDDKAVAEEVRLKAEVERIAAEAEKIEAERVRLEAEVQRVRAEAEKAEAERVRLEAEIELERLEGLLHQSHRMESLGQLAGGVAHDFNNLLAVILNYASFVIEEITSATDLPDGAKWEGPLQDLQQVQVAAERASVLTHQLLAFARREVIQARPLSINEAISHIEEILRRTLGEQIELTTQLEDNLATVTADPGHIEQIILNLAINARDAMPLGGTLSIETSSRVVAPGDWTVFGVKEGPYICIRISDSGGGMSNEVRDRAFEPFFTTKPRGEGSGLGLATVYGIVLQSGGATRIYSDEGVGTTITVLLPANVAGDETEPSVDVPAQPGVGTETVLVVDDEEGLREVTRRILTRNGYTVITAESGAEAIEIARTNPGEIHLLLSDVIMPKMQGPTVAKEVKKIRPNIKVLFMSGHALPVLEAESVLDTQFQLVEKPFDQRLLLDNVRRALDFSTSEPAA